MVAKLGNRAEFSQVDINDSKSLEEALKGPSVILPIVFKPSIYNGNNFFCPVIC